MPESRLLLALLPRMAHELTMSKTIQTAAKFRELLSTLTIGEPTHHHNLTFFPLLWPETHEPPTSSSARRLKRARLSWRKSPSRAVSRTWP